MTMLCQPLGQIIDLTIDSVTLKIDPAIDGLNSSTRRHRHYRKILHDTNHLPMVGHEWFTVEVAAIDLGDR